MPEKGTPQYDNFRYAASLFGYDFTLKDAVLDGSTLTCAVKNVGIAPLYYDWDVELSVADKDGNEVWSQRKQSSISALLPMRRQHFSFDLSEAGLTAGDYTVRFRIVNPLECSEEKRFPLILSNKNRDGEYAIAGKLSV